MKASNSDDDALKRVVALGGGNVDGGVAVVYEVGSPQQWHFMKQTVLPVAPEIPEKEQQDGFQGQR